KFLPTGPPCCEKSFRSLDTKLAPKGKYVEAGLKVGKSQSNSVIDQEHVGRKRSATRLAAGEAESGRKAGRLCCSQNDGFPQGLAQEIQEAPQERAKKAQVEAIGFAAMLGVDVGTVARAIGGSKSDQGKWPAIACSHRITVLSVSANRLLSSRAPC